MKDRYEPSGITAQARQHPMLDRTAADREALAQAARKREEKAARLQKESERWAKVEPKITAPAAPDKTTSRQVHRRITKRALD